MQPLECTRCGNRVQVEKYSWQQTSVQWTAPARSACPALRGAGQGESCPALRDSIRQAVLDGVLTLSEREENP